MKKSIIAIVSAILLITILAISVAAAGAVATTDTKSCAQGETVTLNVNISGDANASSGAVEVIYDKNVLELVSAEWHTDGALLATFDKSTDKGAFAFQTGKNLSGKIFSVTFKVLENAPVGTTTVECKIQLKSGSDNISVTNNAGSINITCKHDFSAKNDQYLASEASCTSPATYYYTCSICGEKGTTTYTKGSAGAHTFDKQVATEAYLVKAVDCVNEAEYYYSCSCGAKGTEKFTADASWSHNFSDNWFISADGHWHQCLDCGAKKDNVAHSPNANNVCGACQFVLSNDGAHYHSFSDAWSKNEDAHWHECSCGLKNDLELHNWNAGNETKPATESAEGEMLFTCTDCGQTKTEAIEKLEGEKQPVVTPTPEESGSPIIYAAVAVVALLVVEAVGFAIYRVVAKKKQPEAIVEVAPEVKDESDDGEQD